MNWNELTLEYNEKGLYINGLSIVETWEEPIQKKLALSVGITNNSRILEIGYGLGLCAKTISQQFPQTHILIEAHQEIAQKAQEEVATIDLVIVKEWQDVVPTLKGNSFDGIIFDSYPLSEGPYNGTSEDTLLFVKDFLTKGERLLKKGGRLSFLDFSCNVHRLAAFEELHKNLFSSFEIREEVLPIPDDCSYARGNIGNIVVLLK